MSHVTPLSLSKNTLSIVALCSASSSQCCQLFCRVARCSKGSWEFTSVIKIVFVSVPFESVWWLHYLQHSKTLFRVLCCRCGIHHGPPSTRLFLSTSAHHSGNSLRNKFSTLICMSQWQILSLSKNIHIIDLSSKDCTGCLTSKHLFTLSRLY